MDPVNCGSCGADLGPIGNRRAFLSVFAQGDEPYPEASCAADVAIAKTCPSPGDKWCECAAHKRLG